MNFEELKSRDVKALRLLAAQHSIKTHHKHTAETIAKLIVEHVTAKPVHGQNAMKHAAEKPSKPPLIINTEEQVREALGPMLQKDGFIATFPGDDTVIFKCKGAEESIHLSSELRWIKIKAESVSRGARLPRAIKDTLHGGPSDLVMMI